MRLAVAVDDDTPPTYWFAKVQTPKDIPDAAAHMSQRVRHEFETTRKVETALAARPGMDALHPIVCYPEMFAIVTQEIHGETLLSYLERRLTWLSGSQPLAEAERVLEQTGAWLRVFQEIEPSHDAIAPSELHDYIDLRLQKLVSSGRSPITEQVRLRLLEHLDALLGLVPSHEWRSVLRHSDLAPGNVMVTPRGVAVLDFAMASRGTYLHDLTRLSLQIDMLRGKPHFRPGSIRRARTALLKGFDTAASESQPLFRVLTLLHRVNHLATLTLRGSRGAAQLYGWRLRRIHERAIDRELQTTLDGSHPPRVPRGTGR